MTDENAGSTITAGIDAINKVTDPASREVVARSWFGRLLGQSTAAILLILGYLATLGLLYKFIGSDLKQFHRSDPLLFWAALSVPLIAVAVFSILPAILKTSREQRLHAILDNPEPPEPGYFRLHPYEAKDAERYTRPDTALTDALDWLETTPETILYLSGASGTGKSSLVAAGLTPKLEAKNWTILPVRGMGAPLKSLTDALHSATHLYAEPPHRNTTAPTLLERAAAERVRTGDGPLLIILDQFEEYLILESGEDQSDYADFLRKLAAVPLAGVKLLHVFRSDYEELIFKQNLPDMIPRQNGFKLAAFTRREAQAFLSGGPYNLDERGYDALFKGLDKVEETRGVYRPITLNMIGFVLEREGTSLADDPGKLIERYLADCIAKGDAQDGANAVLETLITDAGTKEPRTETAIAETSKLEAWRTRAILTALQQEGLVRPLEGSLWEISHDFLARVLGRMLGRVKRPWFQRINAKGLALAGFGWLAAMALAIPLWSGIQTERTLREIRALGFDRLGSVVEGYAFKARWGRVTDDEFAQFGLATKDMPLTSLNLSFARGITDLSPIKDMPLTSLDLSNADGITDLSPIKDMPLTSLDLSNAGGITDLSPIKDMPLTSLDLSFANGITDLSPIKDMPLTSLNLSNADGIKTLAPLKGVDPSIIYGAYPELLKTLED